MFSLASLSRCSGEANRTRQCPLLWTTMSVSLEAEASGPSEPSDETLAPAVSLIESHERP